MQLIFYTLLNAAKLHKFLFLNPVFRYHYKICKGKAVPRKGLSHEFFIPLPKFEES